MRRNEYTKLIRALGVPVGGKMERGEYAQMIAEFGAPPKAGDLDFAPALDDWSAGLAIGNFYNIDGVVSGHPILEDGQIIFTSPLLNLCENLTWARTRSRFYVLGPTTKKHAAVAQTVRLELQIIKPSHW